MKDIYRGELVCLAIESPETMAKFLARWDRDSECSRLAESGYTRLWSEKKIKDWIEKDMEKDSSEAFQFSIHTLSDDTLIGYVTLHPDWIQGDAWIGITIGERDYWGKGFGADAMRLIMQYGFLELNLRRMTLALHSYNERALKSYQKVGFKLEGVMRSDTLREGRRTHGLFMGILRAEWLSRQGGEA